MKFNSVQAGLLIGIFVLLLVLVFRSPVGRYEFSGTLYGGTLPEAEALRLDTKTGVIEACEFGDEEFVLVCGNDLTDTLDKN